MECLGVIQAHQKMAGLPILRLKFIPDYSIKGYTVSRRYFSPSTLDTAAEMLATV